MTSAQGGSPYDSIESDPQYDDDFKRHPRVLCGRAFTADPTVNWFSFKVDKHSPDADKVALGFDLNPKKGFSADTLFPYWRWFKEALEMRTGIVMNASDRGDLLELISGQVEPASSNLDVRRRDSRTRRPLRTMDETERREFLLGLYAVTELLAPLASRTHALGSVIAMPIHLGAKPKDESANFNLLRAGDPSKGHTRGLLDRPDLTLQAIVEGKFPGFFGSGANVDPWFQVSHEEFAHANYLEGMFVWGAGERIVGARPLAIGTWSQLERTVPEACSMIDDRTDAIRADARHDDA